MLILTKNKSAILNQVTKEYSAIDQKIELMNKMNLNKGKNKSKNRRTGSLKFHNFVANCSSVSKNTNGSSANKKTLSNETTHCLKEEHGTKQITVSHWRKSNSSLDSTNNLELVKNSLLTSSSIEQPTSSINESTTKDEQEDEQIKTEKLNSKASKAKSFSLLSNSNPLISRTDFILTNQPNLNANKNLLTKNLTTNNSLQYFNGKQRHLNLKQSSTRTSSSLPTRLFLKTKSLNNQLNNQLNSFQTSNNQLNNDLINQLNNNQLDQIRNQFTNQSNDQIKNQLDKSNLSSLNNLQQSIDQINLILNDNNLLSKANESILSNLLIKETSGLFNNSSFETNRANNFKINQGSLECLNNKLGQINRLHDKNESATYSKQIKSSRRKPIFVRRLIKLENDDLIRKDEINNQINDEQPLDLSLKNLNPII